MGFFSKLKQNFTHGGVKVTLDAPAQIAATDSQFAVTVLLNATDSPQQINKVTVQLERTITDYTPDRAPGSAVGTTNTSTSSPTTRRQTIGVVEHTTPTPLQVGAPVSLQLTVPIQSNMIATKDEVAQVTGEQIAGVIETMQKFSNAVGQNDVEYEVTAVADIEGIALDPSASKKIQITGEITAA